MSAKDDGGQAFPLATGWVEEPQDGRPNPKKTVLVRELDRGMALRDYFAVHAPAQRTDFTEHAAAAVVGREMPNYPGDDASEQARIDHQIATAQFRVDLDVSLRLRWADSMLKARKS